VPTVSPEQTLPLVIALHRLLRGLRRATGDGAAPPTQLIVLGLLNQHGPLRVGELAVRIPCSQPTATAVVAAMRENGLVRREPDPNDGRGVYVVPTEAGMRTLNSVAQGEAEVLAGLLASVPDTERNALLAAAPVFLALADHAAPTPRATPSP
jgi:DNA-binding MarR family transcriptional regulator